MRELVFNPKQSAALKQSRSLVLLKDRAGNVIGHAICPRPAPSNAEIVAQYAASKDDCSQGVPLAEVWVEIRDTSQAVIVGRREARARLNGDGSNADS